MIGVGINILHWKELSKIILTNEKYFLIDKGGDKNICYALSCSAAY